MVTQSYALPAASALQKEHTCKTAVCQLVGFMYQFSIAFQTAKIMPF